MRPITYVLAGILALAIGAQWLSAQTPPTSIGARVELRNALGRELTVTYVYLDAGGEPVSGGVGAPGSIEAGQTWVGSFESSDASITTVEIYAPEIAGVLVGNSYVANGTPSGYRLVGTVHLGGGTPWQKYRFTIYPSESVPDGAKTLWQTDDTTLTANLFREGVDKIVAGQGATATSSSTATLDGTKTELVAEYQYNFVTGASLPTDAAAQSNASVTAMQNAITEHVVRQQGNVTVTATGDGDASFWIVQLPKGNGEFRELDLNPMHVDGVPIIAQWVKIAISVLAIYLFEVWCWEQMQGLVGPAALIPQAKGNTVAGSGGQVTGLLNASAVATVMVSLPAVCFALYQAAFTIIGTVFPATSPIDVMPASGAEPFMTAAFTLINHFIPTTLLLILAAQMFVVRKAAFAIYMATGIVIKYLQF